jgi:hypothetical protein
VNIIFSRTQQPTCEAMDARDKVRMLHVLISVTPRRFNPARGKNIPYKAILLFLESKSEKLLQGSLSYSGSPT